MNESEKLVNCSSFITFLICGTNKTLIKTQFKIIHVVIGKIECLDKAGCI